MRQRGTKILYGSNFLFTKDGQTTDRLTPLIKHKSTLRVALKDIAEHNECVKSRPCIEVL